MKQLYVYIKVVDVFIRSLKKHLFYFFNGIHLLIMTSCFKGLQNKPIQIQEVTLDQTEELGFEMGVLSLDKPDFDKWWELFQDKTLTSLIEEALASNPYLLSVKEKIETAKATVEKERSLLLPKLDATLFENYAHLSKNGLFRYPPSPFPPVVDLIDLTLNFQYEFDFFGKNQHLLKAAVGESMASIADYTEAKLVMSIEVAQHYFNYQLLMQVVEVLSEELQLQKDLLYLTEQRKRFALDDELDVEKMKREILTIENLIVINNLDQMLQLHQINMLRGVSPDTVIDFPNRHHAKLQSIPINKKLSLDLIAQRPDIMSMKWMLEAAAHRVGAAKAAFYPSVNLAAFVGFESLSWSNLFSPSSWLGLLEPSIHLPLYTGGKLTAQLKEKAAQYYTAIYEYNNLILHAAQQVADGVSVAVSVDEELKLETLKYQSMEKTLFLLERRFKSAVDPLMPSLSYQIECLGQERLIFNREYQKRLAMLRIIKALGGGYPLDEKVPQVKESIVD